MTDRIGRVPPLRVSAAVYVALAAVISTAVLYLPSHGGVHAVFYALCGASALAGFAQGIFGVATNALLADSTAVASRNQFFVWKQSCTTAGLASGPLVATACFLATHNTWTQPELTVVCMACAALGLPLSVTMFCFVEVRPQQRL